MGNLSFAGFQVEKTRSKLLRREIKKARRKGSKCWIMLQTDDGQSSCSDDDSVSLLRDLACSQVTDATVDMTAPSGSRCPITPNMETSPKQAQSGEEDESFGRRQCEAGLGEPAEVEKVCKDLKTLNQRQLHKRDSKGETLLHKACRKNNPAEVRMLLQAGISVNMEDYAGWTALHEAAAMGHVTVVEELLKAGATTNARCRGVTPLHDAVCAGHRQVVKLLLEGGSNPRDRNGGGVSALEMADDEEMKELLLTFTAAPAKGERQTGAASSAPRCTRPAHLQVREAGEGPGNLQLMKVSAADLRNSLARRATLEKLKGKQREMRAWRLTGGRSADRFQAACVQIQSVLRDVLSKQRLEKDALCRRFQKVSGSFRRRVLRTHLLSLASCQRTLLEVLQKQLHLEETFAAARTELQAPPPAVQYKSVTGERMEQTPGELGEETGTSCPSGEEDDRSGPLGCPITRGGKPPPHRGLQSNTTGFCRKTFLQQVKVKGQSRTKVSSRPLGLLIQGGALAPGSALQLLWKGKHHLARLLADGSMMSKGKVFPAPERWMEWIIGKNIPVGSAYALDRVTFRDVPLSQLLLNMEVEENTPHSRLEDRMDAPAPPPHDAAGSLSFLLNIRTIRLVGDEEFMPSAIADRYWDQLLQKDFPESDDWNDHT
uniref:Uncharacterized protein n=2 Tax=Oryzias latipes TaxID=8090 RepID=A0A3B3IFX5_ORYLA